jgi:hypothetical protein
MIFPQKKCWGLFKLDRAGCSSSDHSEVFRIRCLKEFELVMLPRSASLQPDHSGLFFEVIGGTDGRPMLPKQ